MFSRTFLSAAAEAGVAAPSVSRHVPILRRCVEPDESVVLVARCVRPDSRISGDFLLMLTQRRLVVIRETFPLHRLRLHLNANLRHLSNVAWNTDARQTACEVALTAVDGVRERFSLRLADAAALEHVESLLDGVFRHRTSRVLARAGA